jgi:hypothetical protein
MPTDHSRLQHIGPAAVPLCQHLDGPASNADTICRMGFPAPIAIEIARQIKAGVGDKKRLFEFCGMSIPDAATFAAFITAAGAK